MLKPIPRAPHFLAVLVAIETAAMTVAGCAGDADSLRFVAGSTGADGPGGASGMGGSGASGATGAGGAGAASPEDAGLPDVLPDFPDADYDPVTTIDGIPSPLGTVYIDKGTAPVTNTFRALMGFPIQNKAELEQAVKNMYDQAHPAFRDYMTVDEWMQNHAPAAVDVQLVKLWLEALGMQVPYVATNRLLLQFTGTVQQFNEAFQTELHIMERKNPQQGNPPFDVYGTLGTMTVPAWVAQRIAGVITADLPADTKPLPGEAGTIEVQPPANISWSRTPAQIAKAYDIDILYTMGYTGQGVKLGVVAGYAFKFKDLQTFWQSMGINRSNPEVIVTMESFATRNLETTLDTEWAGAIAKDAELLVYAGPDARNTSMVYTFNEAVGRNEVSVLTDSFAHREDSEPKAVREQYSDSALMGAALGITICAATGDSAKTDTPSSSPWVTGVGGTRLSLLADGTVSSEVTWSLSGSGPTLSFPLPYWQAGVVVDSGGKRAVADMATNAAPGNPYGMWIYYLGQWKSGYGGTSFSAPVVAGLVAVVNSHRKAMNLPQLGWLNAILYSSPAVQATFRDITAGGTQDYPAGPGWDYPTGWGAPSALGLALAMP